MIAHAATAWDPTAPYAPNQKQYPQNPNGGYDALGQTVTPYVPDCPSGSHLVPKQPTFPWSLFGTSYTANNGRTYTAGQGLQYECVPNCASASASRLPVAHRSQSGSCPDDSGEGGGFVDPSGHVVTTDGAPIPRATVVLKRATARDGPFAPAPPDIAVVHPAINPQRTDRHGHFGWDVLPGFYMVTASRSGCRGAASVGPLTVPPPVFNLVLRLKCPGLCRAATTTTLRLTTVRGAGAGQVAASIAVVAKGARHRAGPNGFVAIRRRGRTIQTLPLDPKTHRAQILLPRRLGQGLAAVYSGDGYFAPSRRRG